jgi:hypothetical protein
MFEKPKFIVSVLGVALGTASLVLGLIGLARSEDNAERTSTIEARQRAFAREVEERQSAPVLAPDIEPAAMGRTISVATNYGTRTKRAERMNVFHENGVFQIIMPMRNVGNGVAVVPFTVTFARTCPAKPAASERLARTQIRYLGTYNVPPGESRQLAFAANDQDRLLYSRATTATRLNLMVIYTDLLGHRVRWTCVTYKRPRHGSAWSVEYPYYGERPAKSG